MKNTECELAFNFESADAKKYINNAISAENITDYYLDSDLRLRVTDTNIELTQKIGSKLTNRTELTSYLQQDDTIETIFKNKSKLTISKTRYIFNGYTIDILSQPLSIATLEIERDQPEKLTEHLENANNIGLISCPLNAWKFHKRTIGLLGGPSSGKTSVSKLISLHLNNNFRANSSDVVEYATSFIQKNKRTPTLSDQVLISIKQQERETAIASSANIVVSDCPSFLSYIYALRSPKDASQQNDYIMQALYKRAVSSINDYDMLFLLETINYRQNNVRYHNLEQSKEIYDMIKNFVINHGHTNKVKYYNYNDTNNIINDILYLNNSLLIDRFINTIGKYKSEVIPT